ncbi:hypothetical protein GCM10025784_14470 [Citricoccus nitrophenolicus]
MPISKTHASLTAVGLTALLALTGCSSGDTAQTVEKPSAGVERASEIINTQSSTAPATAPKGVVASSGDEKRVAEVSAPQEPSGDVVAPSVSTAQAPTSTAQAPTGDAKSVPSEVKESVAKVVERAQLGGQGCQG